MITKRINNLILSTHARRILDMKQITINASISANGIARLIWCSVSTPETSAAAPTDWYGELILIRFIVYSYRAFWEFSSLENNTAIVILNGKIVTAIMFNALYVHLFLPASHTKWSTYNSFRCGVSRKHPYTVGLRWPMWPSGQTDALSSQRRWFETLQKLLLEQAHIVEAASQCP